GVQRLKIRELRPSATQPRKTFDPEALAELTESIREKGVLQPILVRPLADGYEIVAGERRFQAAREAGLETVPVTVRELNDQEALEIAIIENLQREDLNPLEEAEAFEQLMQFGLNQEAVSRAVGKSRSAIANSLRLLSLPPVAKEALADGRISAGHGRAILAQPGEDQDWAIEHIITRQLSVRQAEALKRKAAPRRKRKEPAVLQLEEELTRFAGTKVTISGGNRGKLELHYHSQDELARLLELLGFEA
ncbi:MAG TPA: ParB/RepB/Spo0J family partition protein, partial [Deinococcales bacterium]|nr:ParB/RepB/Spo0J family partition protein [Deinococcales bacterium]